MNTNIRQTLDFLLFSNLFIAVCAVSQALVTYYLLGAAPDGYVLALLFCSTIAMYNYSMILSKPANYRQSPFRRVRWIFSHYRLTVTITIVAALSVIPLTLFLSLQSQLLMLLLALLSVAYSLPVFSIGDKKLGLRNIPGIKVFLIAMVWSLSCVLLPVLELENRHGLIVPAGDTVMLTAKRFLLITAITIPFDIRDLFQDQQNELKTIPVILGEKKAYIFCIALLVLYVLLLFLFTKSFDANFFALMLTAGLAGWLILRAEWERNEYYYFLYLDGIMFLQFIILVITNLII